MKLYETLFLVHDLRFLALAVGICVLGTLTGTAIAQLAIKLGMGAHRSRWMLLAGMVIGLAVWTTHLAAILGYRPDLDIRFDLGIATASLILSSAVATTGWGVGLLNRQYPIFAGSVVGVSIAIAHFLNTSAMRVDGSIEHDPLANSVAVTLGIALAAASGYLFARWKNAIFSWPASLALTAAVVSLYFVAISGVAIVPRSAPLEETGFTVSSDQLATVVVAAFLFFIVAAVTVAWRSENVARAKSDEQDRLIETLEELRKTQDHHRAYVELSPQIAWVADAHGRVTEIAPLWERLVGIPREEGIGDGWARVVHPEDLPRVAALWQEAIQTGNSDLADARYRVQLADGSYRWFRVRARPRRDEEGAILAWYGSLEDIDDQVIAETALRASEERYRLASRATNDVICDWSFEEQRASWAGAYMKVLGYTELEGTTDLDWWLKRIHPDDRDRVLTSQTVALDSGAEYWNEEYRFLLASGDWGELRSRGVIVRNEDGQPTRLVGSMLDITQQKKAEAELNWAAYHDALTKLPNRALHRIRVRSAMDTARETGHFVALVTLDLNNFKELNDTLGHAAGDKVLEEAAKRLASSIPEGATVARLGGDEFAIILPGLPKAEAYQDAVRAMAESLAEPVAFQGMRISISYCSGVAIWPRDGETAGQLLIAADLALYAAKAEMPGTIMEFVPSMKDASERRSRMLSAARAALEEDRIVPFYQPKVNLRTGRIMGWEALLRVQGEGEQIIPPAEIAAAFSDAKISVQLTDRMLSRIFADLARWRSAELDPGRIAVNVSAGDFRQHGLAERLKFHAGVHEQALSAIDIEVTETVLIGQLGPEVSRMLDELRALGVMIALDDFGTGYASLTHLQRFPVDVIKIDRSFVERIDDNEQKGTAVIEAILQMARRLGMQTVAEGVETMEQARYLKARGCTIGQGYFFSRPVPASEVARILTSNPYHRWEFSSAGSF